MPRFAGALPVAGLISLFVLQGCGSDTPDLVEISGKAMVNGSPVSGEGYSVNFFPDKKGKPTSIPVSSDGTFSGKAPEGSCEVTLTKVGGGSHGGDGGKKNEDASYDEPYEPLQNIDVKSGGTYELKFQKGGSSSGPSGGH